MYTNRWAGESWHWGGSFGSVCLSDASFATISPRDAQMIFVLPRAFESPGTQGKLSFTAQLVVKTWELNHQTNQIAKCYGGSTVRCPVTSSTWTWAGSSDHKLSDSWPGQSVLWFQQRLPFVQKQQPTVQQAGVLAGAGGRLGCRSQPCWTVLLSLCLQRTLLPLCTSISSVAAGERKAPAQLCYTWSDAPCGRSEGDSIKGTKWLLFLLVPAG